MDTAKGKLFHPAHISPHLTYASTVVISYLTNVILFTEDLQNGWYLTTDTKLRYKERLMFSKVMLVLKAYKKLAPPYLEKLFICSNTRTTSRFITLPKPRIDPFKSSFSFSGASLWNTIPTQIKSCNSLTNFKTQLHRWFRSRLLCLDLVLER